ncbi:MAG: uroporphyrinogen-III synthase [Coriobacteriia bacterium]|nr:uroporphyrinogen-III synthase [Coriobacteriia bacterium]
MIRGRRIILTRAAGKNEEMAARISEAGGSPFIFPTIASAPVADDHIIREALAQVERYSFIVFTSAQAVEYFTHYRKPLPQGERLRYVAVGSATAKALRARGVADVLVPDDFRAEGVVKLFTGLALDLKKSGAMPMTREPAASSAPAVLVPRALVAREVLPQALEQLGFEVTVAPLYETVLPEVSAGELSRVLQVGPEGQARLACDAVVFTSPSTAKNFVTLIEQAAADRMGSGTVLSSAAISGATLLAEVDCYSIGTPTTTALRHLAVPEDRIYQAPQATTDSLFATLSDYSTL